MKTNKKNIDMNNGWSLCPSKTFPGKLYYFNVLTGEAAWSLNEADKKCLNRDTTIADKSHNYPEPTSLPEDNAMGTQVVRCHIDPNSKNPNIVRTIPCNENLPSFGKPTFQNYVANTTTLMPNIFWAPVQMPMPMFCPETKQPMFDKVTQTADLERQLFIQTCDIPLCKRFKNYENPSLCFENNKIVTAQRSPHINNSSITNQLPNNIKKTNVLIKEPILKLESEKPQEMTKNNSKSTLIFGNRVESTNTPVPNIVQEEEELSNLDRTDLRFVLLAKRRKSVDAIEEAVVERKKPKATKVTQAPPKKKVTFDLSNLSEVETDSEVLIEATVQGSVIPNNTKKPGSPILGLKGTTSTPNNSKISHIGVNDLPLMCQQKDTGVQMNPNDTWYIVVDTDVLLLDKEFIDELVLSDNKCKLLIPHAVRADLAALCVGDCRGQQRVLNARQITRRLEAPPPYYIVEPEPDNEDDIVVTTDSILQCCINAVNDNHYVVLITNDPYLQVKASSLHIPNYKLNEIKNELNTKPDVTSEFSKINVHIPNDDLFKNNISKQNKSNVGLFSDNAKKQLFLNNDKDILDCDKLINITKPKSLKNNDSFSICDTDINKKLENLNLTEQNRIGTSFDQTVCKNNKYKDENTSFENIKNTLTKSNHEMLNIQKGSSIKSTEIDEDIFYCNPNSKIIKLLQNPPTFEIDADAKTTDNVVISFNTKISSKNDPYQNNRETKILNAKQCRVKKIFNNINFNSIDDQLENQKQISKKNDPTGTFKVPQSVPLKNKTRNRSDLDGNATTNDTIRQQELKKTESPLETLKRFRVKSEHVYEKLSSRMEEWICTYIHIMDDVLNQILQNNSECMKDTVDPLTLHDTFNCIKMLYDSHTKVRDTADKTWEFINKCIYKNDKQKSLNPHQFMKMFKYGVFLLMSLEEILPDSEDLTDAGKGCSILLAEIESTDKEDDPIPEKKSNWNYADANNEILRPNFSKDPSYIINYLKKHYKAWMLNNEDSINETSKSQNNSNVKVLRTSGKHINLLKFDNSKTMSLSKNVVEADSTKKTEDKPEIMSLVKVNQTNKRRTENNLIVNSIDIKENAPKLTKLFPNEENIYLKNTKNLEDDKIVKSKYFTNENVNQKTDKVIKLIKKPGQDINNARCIVEKTDYPHPGNALTQNSGNAGPKVIRDMKLIDEYEKRIQNRESLDLDLLDYSEIYEPSVMEHLQTNNASDNSESTIANNDNNTKSTLSDYTEDIDFRGRNKFHMSSPILQFKNYSYTFKKKLADKLISANPKINLNNDNDYLSGNDIVINRTENDTYNDNIGTNNDSCIDISEINNDISETHNDNFDIRHDNSGMRNDNDNFDKLAQVRDDSTNDSGFENESTYAHSVVKIFLYELSTSFKVIYEFVNKFIAEIRDIELCELKKNKLHNQASKSLEDMAAIVQRLRSIIQRESAEDTVLRTLLLKAGVEATTDKRMTRYKQIVMKSLDQAQILENALRIIASITKGDFDFDAVSTNAHSVSSSKIAIKYFNIFEQP